MAHLKYEIEIVGQNKKNLMEYNVDRTCSCVYDYIRAVKIFYSEIFNHVYRYEKCVFISKTL